MAFGRQRHIGLCKTPFQVVLVMFLIMGIQPIHAHEIVGTIRLDGTWQRKIYLSLVPGFDDMNTASIDFMIQMAEIDADGQFRFEGNNLPSTDRLYRLHVCKEGDPVATIFIGGQEENYVHFVMNDSSSLEFSNEDPLFAGSRFTGHPANDWLAKLEELVEQWKRPLHINSLANQENNRLLLSRGLYELADTTRYEIVAMLALHHLDLSQDFDELEPFFDRLITKWKKRAPDSPYLQEMEERLAFARYKNSDRELKAFYWILGIIGISILGLIVYRNTRDFPRKEKNIEDESTLTIQEQKIYYLLSKGKTNKEIASELNVSVSTVKSHLHSIYGKLGIVSRKEAYRAPK